MSSQPSPHDAVFRRVLGEPANAASQLRAVLPGALLDRLDLDRLTRVSGSFVDATLRWRHSDLLFTVPLLGRQALVYVLVEHQSSEDPLMPFRMLRYVVRIWDRYLSDHPEAVRLPAVIPLVVHHNRRPWASSTQVLDLLDLDLGVSDVAEDYLPRFQFILDDLARVDEQALRARALTAPARVTLLLLKIAAGNRRLADDLKAWADDLRAVLARPGGTEQFVALLRYIELVGEAPTDELHELVAALGPEAEEAYVTTAEMLRAEGEARGEARGRAEGEARGEARGRAAGEARGRAEALAQLLALKFGPLPRGALDSVNAASTGQLETWTARVLTADTLADVLR
jgi:predicted transposase YdaD